MNDEQINAQTIHAQINICVLMWKDLYHWLSTWFAWKLTSIEVVTKHNTKIDYTQKTFLNETLKCNIVEMY